MMSRLRPRAGTTTANPSRAALEWALGAILACQLMVVLDGTVIYTALPHIRTELALSRTSLSWVQNAYMLSFGGLLLLGARTGDLIGHGRVFIVANAVFAAASAAGGFAQSAPWLLVARAVQGAAGAFAAPAGLALLMCAFPDGAARARAIRLYTAVSGVGSTIGLVLGGLLTDLVSWRWVLFVNLPICIGLLIVSLRHLPRTRPARGRLDIAGALTITLAMSLIVYGFIHAASGNPGPVLAATLMVSAVLLCAFVAIEKHAALPITPLALFSSPSRSGAYAGKMLLIGGMLGTFFFLTQYVQEALGFDPLQAGLSFVPLSLTQCLMVIYGVPWLTPRIGSLRLLVAGMVIALAGMLCLSRVVIDTAFMPGVFFPLVLLGLGTGAALVPFATAGLAGVASRDAGAAAGMMSVTHYIGGALGTALLVVIVNIACHPVALSAANGSLEGDPKQIIVNALAVSALASAVFFAFALLIVLATMRRPST
jgi:EmrB/QacA subfamily drug resistance transporter